MVRLSKNKVSIVTCFKLGNYYIFVQNYFCSALKWVLFKIYYYYYMSQVAYELVFY